MFIKGIIFVDGKKGGDGGGGDDEGTRKHVWVQGVVFHIFREKKRERVAQVLLDIAVVTSPPVT